MTGSWTADGRIGERNTSMLAARIVVAWPSGSPVPRLRAYTGCAPLLTWSRTRCPRRKVLAMGHSSTPTRMVPSAPRRAACGRSRTMPSLRFHDRPLGSTSHRRTNRSVWSRLDRTQSSARTGPTTVRSWANTSLL